MKTYEKSVLEYDDIKNAVLFAEERAEIRGEIRGEKRATERTLNAIPLAINEYRRGTPLTEIAEKTGLPFEWIVGFVNNL